MRVIRLAVHLSFVALIVSTASSLEAQNPSPFKALAETWTVEFENGVKQVCKVTIEGEAVEKEANRSAKGKAEPLAHTFIIKFEDDRVERWTPVGRRMVVEHWFPASNYPEGPRVLGVADRTQ